MIHFSPEERHAHADHQGHLANVVPWISLHEEIELAKWLERQGKRAKLESKFSLRIVTSQLKAGLDDSFRKRPEP